MHVSGLTRAVVRNPAGGARRRAWLALALGLPLAAVLFATGCSTKHYTRSADREVYGTIEEKAPMVKNMEPRFSIEQTNVLSLDELPAMTTSAAFLGPDGAREVGARVISLDRALGLAIRHNRAYQSRKEQLYLSALGLTLVRHQFRPAFSAGGQARIIGQTEQAVDVVIDPITQQPKVLLSDNLVEQQRVTAGGSFRGEWLIRDVGRLSMAFTTDFLRFITGDPRTVTSSQLSGTFARPLLRNAGFKAQIEGLTQAERELLYGLREFTQFRKDFTVQVANAYYGVLGSRDTVRNIHLNLESSRNNAARTRALAQEGRVSQTELGRWEQQELDAEDAWINAVRSYKQALDDFKLSRLGVPVELNLVLDDQELAALRIEHPSLSVEDSTKVALVARLDYQNARDRHDDAQRQVGVAANFLKAQVDLLASAGINSMPESGPGFPTPELDRYRWSAGLDVDLPLDRKAERNTYRRALISEKQTARDLEQQADRIRLDVRDSWRTLDQAKRAYEINEVGVRIAERRVEEQNLLAELGRARAQDQVDAQNALNASKNQRTRALVEHTIARLQFWNNMGILYIKDCGRWEEVHDGTTQ
jgi:outer membrane protein TolC